MKPFGKQTIYYADGKIINEFIEDSSIAATVKPNESEDTTRKPE